jgi:hypothetical protein
MTSWTDGRKFSRETIRDLHVVLNSTGLQRDTISTVLYTIHIVVPIVSAFLYLLYPALRPTIVVCIVLVVLTQLYSRTCPMAKLEWSVDPSLEKITWKGAEVFNCVTTVNKSIRFYFMVITTTFGLMSLWVVSYLFPKGLNFD